MSLCDWSAVKLCGDLQDYVLEGLVGSQRGISQFGFNTPSFRTGLPPPVSQWLSSRLSLLTTSCISWHTYSLTWTRFLQTRGRSRIRALAVWRPLSPGHLFLVRQWSACFSVGWRLYGGCFRDSLKDSPAERWVLLLYCGQWSGFCFAPKLTCTSGRHVSDTQNKLYYDVVNYIVLLFVKCFNLSLRVFFLIDTTCRHFVKLKFSKYIFNFF